MQKIDKDVLLKAIIKYYKKICIYMFISMVVGGVIGYIYAVQGEKEVVYYAEQIEMFEDEEKDRLDYYNQYIENLKIYYEKITKYINELSGFFKEDQKDLKELLDSVRDWEKRELKLAQEYNTLEFPVLPECVDQKRQNIEYNLYLLECDKIEAEKNYNLIQDMGDISIADEDIIKTYGNILSSASSYGMLNKRIDIYKQQLDTLNNRSEQEVENVAGNMDSYLNQATQGLNIIAGQVNQLAARIAKKNYVVIDVGIGANPDDPNGFGVYVYHLEKRDSVESIICAFAVFFLLFGGSVGLLSAIYRVCKEDENAVSK